MSKKENQKELWEREWVGMPEFKQEDLTSERKIIVHFRNEDDVDKFAELLGQTITKGQKSLWYPEKEARIHADKVWVDEDYLKDE